MLTFNNKQHTYRPGEHLYRQIDVPTFVDLKCTLTVHTWLPRAEYFDTVDYEVSATVRPFGTRARAPVALVDVNPTRVYNGMRFTADSISVSVSWGVPSVQPVPVVAGGQWYDPETPYARVRTKRDGVAFIAAEDILPLNQRFRGVNISNLALIWKGAEQYIAIIDSDNSNTFTISDTILFQGRRPVGDSTFFYSMTDSVSVFFLTTRTVGERLRLNRIGSTNPSAVVDRLSIEEHVELDTGYYHLGSAYQEDYGEFNTDLVWLEGFYWERLNANAYQKGINRYLLTPAPGGNVSFSVLYATSTDVQSANPDTRADFIVNGYQQKFLASDGFDKRRITIDASTADVVSGQQSFALYSTGIDSVRLKLGYISDVLLDAFEIQGDVLPVLDSGRLNARVGKMDAPYSLTVSNASSPGYLIDTTNKTWAPLYTSDAGRVIRAGLSPRDRAWSTDALTQGLWRATATIDNSVVEVDSLQNFLLAVKGSTDNIPVVTMFTNADDLAGKIAELPANTACVVMNAGGAVTGNLQSSMASKKLTVPTESNWVVAGIVSSTSAFGSSNGIKPFGTTLRARYSPAPFKELRADLPASESGLLFLADGTGLEHARVEQANLNNLGAVTSQTDMFIITYKTHREQAERLAQHRRKTNGVNVRVVDIDDVIDEFGYGFRSPEGLRQYLWHAYSTAAAPKPKYVILFGSASWDPRLAVKGGNVNARLPDQIPTYGRPSSDYYFSMLDDPKDYGVPEVIVGRIPALLKEHGVAVVDKIISHDTTVFQPWMRRWMFVGGGSEGEGLCDTYKYMLKDPFETGITFTDPPLCLDTVTLCKYEAPPNAGFYLRQEINKGLQWMNYFGHGALEIFDITGWEPNELANPGRYGVLATYSCQTGAYSNPSKLSKNGQYVTEPNKGFVAAVGGTGWGRVATLTFLLYKIHENLRDTSVSTMFRFLGDLYYASKVEFAYRGDQDGLNALQQNCLLGDPLLRIRIDTLVNVFLRQEDVTVTNKNGSTELTDADSLGYVNVMLNNSGIGTEAPFVVSLKHTYTNFDTTTQQIVSGICVGSRIVFPVPIFGKPGTHTIEINADAEYVLDGDTLDNKVITSFTVLPQALLPLDPVSHGAVTRSNWFVRVLDPTDKANTVQFAVCDEQSLKPENILLPSMPSEITRDRSIVDWKTTVARDLPLGPAWIAAWLTFEETQQSSAVMWIPITITDAKPAYTARVYANLMNADTPDSLQLDSVNNVYRLSARQHTIYVRSSGLSTPNVDVQPVLEFRVDDKVYLKNPFLRGINLMVMNEIDTVPYAFRWYDTYFDPYPPEVGYNGTTSDLIRFLRDSVTTADRVAFAASKESFSGFKKDDNLDSLKEILGLYGSRFADSLDSASSWAMVGQRGMRPGEAAELWKAAPDSIVTLITSLPFYARSGKVSTDWIFAGSSWDSVWLEQSQSGVQSSIVGKMLDGSERAFKDFSDSSIVWRPDTSQQSPQMIRILWKLNHVGGDTASARVSAAYVSFTPAHEWILEQDNITLTQPEVLRGDTAYLRVLVRNADIRNSTPPSQMTVTVDGTSAGAIAYRGNTTIGPISADDSLGVVVAIPTIAAGSQSNVSVVFDENREQYQFYTYNDRRAIILTVKEDNTPPTIAVQADGKDVTQGAYVLRNAFIEILLKDNSQLPINDSNRLVVFINGDRIRTSNTTDYKWLTSQSTAEAYPGSNVRAALQFRYPLEMGQNNVIVRSSDATGNEQEFETQLWTTDNNEVESVSASPTPTSGPIRFFVVLKTDRSETSGTIEIFDLNGRRVRSLNTTLSVGTSVVEWDGLGDDGQSMPTGMYVYHLRMDDATGAPLSKVSGNLMILR
ncbi:MAG: hypothetical protein HYX66_01800 [Ignavibacteria bacterium]|nr:hypothetical protein [Ignavibacteria bacterium]